MPWLPLRVLDLVKEVVAKRLGRKDLLVRAAIVTVKMQFLIFGVVVHLLIQGGTRHLRMSPQILNQF